MILNLTGNHLITLGAVYPASGPYPIVRFPDIPPDYPTPAEILADLGVPAEGVTAITGTPIRVTPIPGGIDGFPDIPAGVSVVIVQSRIAEAMRRLGLTVRHGVAILSPALQRWLTADDAIRLAPNHAAAIRSLPDALTWADALTLYDDLTGMHDAPGLYRESPEHPVDAALCRFWGGTGVDQMKILYTVENGEAFYSVLWSHSASGTRPDRAVNEREWKNVEAVIVDRLRARGALPPERLDGGGR